MGKNKTESKATEEQKTQKAKERAEDARSQAKAARNPSDGEKKPIRSTKLGLEDNFLWNLFAVGVMFFIIYYYVLREGFAPPERRQK